MKLSQILEAKHIDKKRVSRFYTPEPTDNVRCSECGATYTIPNFVLRRDHPGFRKTSLCPACRTENHHYLNEAKHMSFSAKDLAEQLRDIVHDSFYYVYHDDYDTREDYLDAAITNVMKSVEKASPPEHKKRIVDTIWSAYAGFDESEFVDTDSVADAILNDIVSDLHSLIHFRLGLTETAKSRLKKELQKIKKRKTRKDLAKMEDPLDKDHMAGHTDNGPSFSQSTRN